MRPISGSTLRPAAWLDRGALLLVVVAATVAIVTLSVLPSWFEDRGPPAEPAPLPAADAPGHSRKDSTAASATTTSPDQLGASGKPKPHPAPLPASFAPQEVAQANPAREADSGADSSDHQAHAAGRTQGAEPAREPPTTTPPVIEHSAEPTGSEPADREPAVAEPHPASDAEHEGAHSLDRSPEERKRRLERFGGSRLTEDAVDAGLAWLAAHQGRDGSWDRIRFQDRCPPGSRCGQPAVNRVGVDLTPGLTGLVLLAFLGAGHDGQTEPYVATVRAALDALLASQQPHGGFGTDPSMAGYNDSLATFALAEYVALTGDRRVRGPLERGVARLVASQQLLGGWDYTRNPETGRNDTSITAWVVQALQAAAAAGVEIPRGALAEASLHFVRAAGDDGRVWYSDAGTGFRLDQEMLPEHRFGPAMTACGLLCKQLLGWRLDGPLTQLQERLLLADPPSASRARGRDPAQLHSEYYWYYGTAAMFQRGGDAWTQWNGRLRDALLPMQNRERTGDRKKHEFGSFPAYGHRWGKWGRMGGTVYTTALAVLTLEIYYRETPAYLREELAVGARDWRRLLEQASPRRRLAAIECLGHLRLEIAEPVLVELLEHTDKEAALAAAAALCRLDSPLGVPTIEAALPQRPPSQRANLQRLVRQARLAAAATPPAGHVRHFDPGQRLATLELPGVWLGQMVSLRRDGVEIAQARIIRRYTGRSVVVAEVLGPAASPASGDQAVALVHELPG